MSSHPHIVLIGCGKMGSALLSSWLNSEVKAVFSVVEPHDIPFQNIDHYRDTVEAHKALAEAQVAILAIKPQIMAGVCSTLKSHLNKETLVLSIAAGQSIASFQNYFGDAQPIIRAMPNIPASIGKGITVAVPTKTVTAEHKELAQNLLETAGHLEWLKDETLINAITAVSGSGPAYVFLLIEALAAAGEKAGLPKDLSMTLARQTVIGSAALAEEDKATAAATLRKNVTSPNGTTEAALKILMNGEFQTMFDKAIAAAKERGEELNS